MVDCVSLQCSFNGYDVKFAYLKMLKTSWWIFKTILLTFN